MTAELAAESPNAGPLYRQSTGRAEPKDSIRPAEVVQRWVDVVMFGDRPLKRSLSGLGLEYRDRSDLQPRRRQARGEDQLQRRPGDAGPRLPQRRRHPVHVRAGGDRRARRPRRRRPAGDGVVPLSRRAGAGLSRRPAGGSRPTSSSIRRSIARAARPCCLPPGTYQRRVHARAGIRRADRRRSPCPTGQDAPRGVPAQALDPPGQDELVLGRSPRPRGRLRALREPDRGGQARGHEAAHPGRGPRRRLRPVAGGRAGTPRSSSSRARSTRSRRPST